MPAQAEKQLNTNIVTEALGTVAAPFWNIIKGGIDAWRDFTGANHISEARKQLERYSTEEAMMHRQDELIRFAVVALMFEKMPTLFDGETELPLLKALNSAYEDEQRLLNSKPAKKGEADHTHDRRTLVSNIYLDDDLTGEQFADGLSAGTVGLTKLATQVQDGKPQYMTSMQYDQILGRIKEARGQLGALLDAKLTNGAQNSDGSPMTRYDQLVWRFNQDYMRSFGEEGKRALLQRGEDIFSGFVGDELQLEADRVAALKMVMTGAQKNVRLGLLGIDIVGAGFDASKLLPSEVSAIEGFVGNFITLPSVTMPSLSGIDNVSGLPSEAEALLHGASMLLSNPVFQEVAPLILAGLFTGAAILRGWRYGTVLSLLSGLENRRLAEFNILKTNGKIEIANLLGMPEGQEPVPYPGGPLTRGSRRGPKGKLRIAI